MFNVTDTTWKKIQSGPCGASLVAVLYALALYMIFLLFFMVGGFGGNIILDNLAFTVSSIAYCVILVFFIYRFGKTQGLRAGIIVGVYGAVWLATIFVLRDTLVTILSV